MPTTIDELKVLLKLHGLKCVRMHSELVYLVRDGQYYNTIRERWERDRYHSTNREIEIDFYPVVRSWLADGMPI